MKMVMIIIEASKKEELEVFLERCGVTGYTEISQTAGKGSTGFRLGSRAFPHTSAVILTALDRETLERLQQGIDGFCAECGEQLKVFSWEVEQLR
jgi:nitrogen regulatory protein PII